MSLIHLSDIQGEITILREICERAGQTVRDVTQAVETKEEEAAVILEKAAARGYVYKNGDGFNISTDGKSHLECFRVDNAIFLAAGFGARFVPLTYETPKGLLEVKGTPMIERQIVQLHEKGIREIVIVVGYMKERFDYLIDRYGVKLVYNPEFATKNNLASLYHALPYFKSSYLLCADNWIETNMFNTYEPCSWFSCPYIEGETHEWPVIPDAEGRITRIDIGGRDTYVAQGPAFFTSEDSARFASLVRNYYEKHGTEDYYWEHVLRDNLDKISMYVNRQKPGNVNEFENLAELRLYDPSYINDTKSAVIEEIARIFHEPQGFVCDLFPIKEGLTNSSFHFAVKDREFVYRKPGTGTDKLIDRRNEKRVYEQLDKLDLTDKVVSFNAETGVKISEYYAGTRVADSADDVELSVCMKQIRRIHDLKLSVEHAFNIDGMIEYYLSLAEGINAVRFSDMQESKVKLRLLLDLKKRLAVSETLCHGDYAHVNVLMFPTGGCRIIDWEYSGMADPIMDVAMYGIFAYFDRERLELALTLYCGRAPERCEYERLYLYTALGGFLWSMWSEYKQGLGQEFGEYPMIMYRYFKDYYKLLEGEGRLET